MNLAKVKMLQLLPPDLVGPHGHQVLAVERIQGFHQLNWPYLDDQQLICASSPIQLALVRSN